MQIVKVKYVDTATGEIQPREYSYFSEEPLAVGDQVIVPVRGHSMTSIVTAVDVPEAEIAAFRDAVKTIPAGAREISHPVAITVTASMPTSADNAEIQPDGTIGRIIEPYYTDSLTESQVKEINDKLLHGSVRIQPPASVELPPLVAFDKKWEELGKAHDASIRSAVVALQCDTVAIRIRPQDDPAVVALSQQAEGLKRAALARNFTVNEDLKPATDDLILIGKVLKAVKAAMNDYVNPIKGYLKDVQSTFQTITGPLDEADAITRQKVLAYNAAAEKRQAEAEAINRQAEELARKQAEMNAGAFTVNTEPIIVPPPVHKVTTESGTVGGRDNWKAKVINFSLLSDEYKLPNEQVLNAYARSTKGQGTIPGVEFVNDKGLNVRAK